jgi:predicted AlkP superfamily pyrophosphatase or phosphodiesterase
MPTLPCDPHRPRRPRQHGCSGSRVRWVAALVLAGGAGLACSGAQPVPAPPHASAPDGAPSAQLVVAVIIDQLGTNVLERYWEALPADGALRGAAARGVVHRRVAYPYAGTYTAPGHATVHTGVSPRRHGIVANSVYDRRREAVVASVDDGVHPWLGAPDRFAGPARLTADTVADRLRAATGGRARVVALSVKDRGAVLPGGRRPDLALWYDLQSARYTTSTHYARALPDWLTAFNERHPVEDRLEPWEPGDPALLARHAGADDAPGEGGWLGLGATFPHDPRATQIPRATALAMPRSSEHLLDLAWEAVQRLDLGGDDIPDLLSISIASTDYAGHVFGPFSWEYLDNLLRIDRALGRFLDRLEERTRVAVLITSDHGVAPMVDQVGDGTAAARVDMDALMSELDEHLDDAIERGDWVTTFASPFVYLSDWARAPERRADAVRLSAQWLARTPGLEAAYDARSLAATDPATVADDLERAVALSIAPDPDADLFVVPARHFVFDESMVPGKGTTHGSPWPYDREVPVAFWGPGVQPRMTHDAHPMTRTAPTLESLLGLPARPGAPSLPGAPR